MLGGNRLRHGVIKHRKNVLRQQAVEELLGRLLVDVVHVRGAELLRFLVRFRRVRGLELDARAQRRFRGALRVLPPSAPRRR